MRYYFALTFCSAISVTIGCVGTPTRTRTASFKPATNASSDRSAPLVLHRGDSSDSSPGKPELPGSAFPNQSLGTRSSGALAESTVQAASYGVRREEQFVFLQESKDSKVEKEDSKGEEKSPDKVEEKSSEKKSEKNEKKDGASVIAGPVASPLNGMANGNGPVMTLLELEAIALCNHPAIASSEASTSRALGFRQQVGTRPNPTLGYFGQQIADKGTDQHGLFVEQEYVRGNKLSLNQEVLGHTVHAQRWETEAQRHRILTDVRVRYHQAAMAQAERDAIQEFAILAKKGVQVAEDRVKAEEGTLIEVLQAQTLLSEVNLAREQAEADLRGAWRDLTSIAGIPETQLARLETQIQSTGLNADWEGTYWRILEESPELKVARELVCEKHANLRRQQVQAIPNVTGQLGAGIDNGTDSGMINVQLSAPIPTQNKNAGNIAAAWADYTRAVENVKRIELSIRSRLARAAQELESAQAAVTKYESEILPQVDKSFRLSEEAYRAGELDFLQVLVVRRSYYESSVRLIQARGKLAQSQAMVDGLLLTGGIEAPLDLTSDDGLRGASLGGQ